MDLLRAAPGAEIVLAAVAGEPNVYAVGGAVRDALLGRVPRELDLVVEGDAIALARRAAERVGGALTVHDRFGTATIKTDDFAFDLVSARKETYARPGALPDVRLGATIAEDLARRDFTVNAMAAGLQGDELIAWPSARADLADGVLRVLHDRSFEDDPTRMLRLARYVARLGFAPADPVDPERLDTVSGDRLGHEVRRMFDEPARVWRDLQRLGLAAKLFGPGFAPSDRSGLAGLADSTSDVPDLEARLDHLKLPAKERDAILAYRRLRGAAGSDADLWRRFRRERPDTLELLAEAGDAAAERWREHIRHRALAITGHDLVAAGLSGARVGEGLEKATVAMLEGRAPDRESQLAAALV